MIFCEKCNANLLPTAKFCHACGTVVKQPSGKTTQFVAKYNLNFSNTQQLSEEIKHYFFLALRQKLQDELNPEQYSAYLDAYYQSGFKEKFEVRAAQLAEECYTIHSKMNVISAPEIDFLLDKTFEELLDYFIIIYCEHLNSIKLPQAILKHQHLKALPQEPSGLIFDYLNLSEEPEAYYFDFVTMPPHKLKNAVKSFLFPAQKEESILVICDQTVFGSCKEGFALTNKALYWKAHFNAAQFVRFEALREVKRQNDWITINGHYFHVNQAVNIKMLKLLNKLKRLA